MAVLLGLSPCFAAGTARAQGADEVERGVAQQLFVEGKRLMRDGDYEHACPKFAESHRLDPGGGTILNLGVCHEAQGRYASAWAELEEALDLARTAGRRDREALALERLAAVQSKVSRLTVAVDAAADVDGLVVSLDGRPLARAAWGTALPVDPGLHEVRATAPGRSERRVSVSIVGPAANAQVRVASLSPLPGAEAVAAPPTPAAPATGQATGQATGSAAGPPAIAAEVHPTPGAGVAARDHTARNAGLIVGGVGVAAVVAGSLFGVEAISLRHESDGFCQGSVCATQHGVDLNDSAQRFANYANIGFAVGVIGVVAGAYLLWTSARGHAAALPGGVRLATAGPGGLSAEFGLSW